MIMKPIESIDYRGYTINVYRDEDAENPRNNSDFTSRFWNNTRRHTFDRRRESSIEDIMEDGRLSEKFIKNNILVEVYLYSHSGESVSTTPCGDPWDHGLFGILAENKDSVRKEFGVDRISPKLHDMIVERLTAEVEEFNQWLNDEVYGYEITREDDDEVITSCWGFYGDYSDRRYNNLLDDAIAEINWRVDRDNEIAERERQEAEEESCEFWSGDNAA